MRTLKRKGMAALFILVAALVVLALAAAACGDDDEEEGSPAAQATPTAEEPTDGATVEPEETPTEVTGDGEPAGIAFNGASATITVDGDNSDWAGIEGATVPLKQIEIPPGLDWDEPNPVDPIDATLKVAADDENIYVLMEVPDDYDFNLDDHNLSGSPAVMFLIDQGAGPHMGTGDEDFEVSLGMVDIWLWELDCEAGAMSGGGDPGSGDDPECNLDDEFANDPEAREDDGGGDTANPDAENSIAGVWEHTARSAGTGADGTWIFEMSRPLQTGDSEDAQFVSGGMALVALAYFDADETAEGWTDTGHLQSSDSGWIEVTLP